MLVAICCGIDHLFRCHAAPLHASCMLLVDPPFTGAAAAILLAVHTQEAMTG
jgi:hypothetical protein